MQNNPRKHHFLPETYLTPFTNSKRKFWKKDLKTSKTSEISPAQVGYELNLNKLRTENAILFNNASDEYHIEKEAFKTQENNYGNTVRKVIKFYRSPTIIEKKKYYLFLETLVTIKRRNPISRQIIVTAFQEGINQPNYITKLKSFLKEEIGEENFPEDIDEYLKNYFENEARNPDRLHDMYLSAFINKTDFTTIRKLTDDLYALKQYILHAPIGSQFITSDNPGYTVVNDQVLKLGGFGDNFSFFFPLSPSTCLFLNSKDKEDKDSLQKLIYPLIIDKGLVKQINNHTRSVSDKFIFSLEKKNLII